MTLIRDARPGDEAELLRLYAQLATGPEAPPAAGQVADFFTRISRYPDYRIHVVDGHADRLVAAYSLFILDHLAHGGRPSAVVEHVVVDATERGRGLGRSLMAHARERAAAAGCYKIALSSNRLRESAHAFYEALGWRRHGYSYEVSL